MFYAAQNKQKLSHLFNFIIFFIAFLCNSIPFLSYGHACVV